MRRAAIGAGRARIIFRHLVPNLMSVVIVYLTLTIPQVMLFEAFLSFLGLGVQAPAVSWGLLANQGFRVITPVKIYWWLFVFPSVALGLTLFALNFLGDGLRDVLDPRLKNGDGAPFASAGSPTPIRRKLSKWQQCGRISNCRAGKVE